VKGLDWLRHMFLVDDEPHAETRKPRRGRRWRERHPARRGTRCAICGHFVPYSEATVIVEDQERKHVCIEHGKRISGPVNRHARDAKKRRKRDWS